jgi:SAM-dependent methyltransferase
MTGNQPTLHSLLRKLGCIGLTDTIDEAIGRSWSRCHVSRILDSIDTEAFADIRQRYHNATKGVGKPKYLDIEYWLMHNLRHVHRLGLQHASPPLDVLDIGTGFGYFPFLCQHFGHRALGLDTGERVLYDEVIRLLGVSRRSWRVEAHQRLPNLGKTFDVVTALMVVFDRYGDDRKPWGTEEWQFFLADLKHNHLVDGGRIFLQLNRWTNQSPALRKFFREKGAQVDRGQLYFKSVKRI